MKRHPSPCLLLAILLGNCVSLFAAGGSYQLLADGPVRALDLSERGELAVASERLLVYDLSGGSEVREFPGHAEPVGALVFLPGGERLLAASPDALVLWDVVEGTRLEVVATAWEGSERLAVSPDGEWVASVGPGGVRLRPLDDLETVYLLEEGPLDPLDVAFSPDSKLLAASGRQGQVSLLEVEDRSPVHQLEGHDGYVTTVAFHPDGLRLLSTGDDHRFRVWEVITGELLEDRELHHRAWVEDLALAPGGQLAASGGADAALLLWELGSLRPRTRFEGHSGSVRAVAFDPGGSWLVSGGQDGTVRVWDLTVPPGP